MFTLWQLNVSEIHTGSAVNVCGCFLRKLLSFYATEVLLCGLFVRVRASCACVHTVCSQLTVLLVQPCLFLLHDMVLSTSVFTAVR